MEKFDKPKDDSCLKLETSRFNISNETLAFLKQARLDLNKLQKDAPFILGYSFFGSRMVGKQKEGSDLDCFLMYDNEYFNYYNFKKNSPQLPIELYKKGDIRGMEGMEDFFSSAKTWIENLNKENSLKIPYHIAGAVDISNSGIKMNIDNFAEYLNKISNDKENELMGRHYWAMVAPFFLSVGEGVYEARTKIFTELDNRENREELWKKTIELLSLVERDVITEKRDALPKYKIYPQTISEAKDYFISK